MGDVAPSAAARYRGPGLAEKAGAIRSPLLIVVGELDRLRPNCERLHELVPGSQYHVVDGFLTRVLSAAGAGGT